MHRSRRDLRPPGRTRRTAGVLTALCCALALALTWTPALGGQTDPPAPSWVYSPSFGRLIAERPDGDRQATGITTSGQQVEDPEVSADGATLYVADQVTDDSGDMERIVAIDLVTGQSTVIADGPGSRGAPSPTPDGQAVLHREGDVIVRRDLASGQTQTLVATHDRQDHPAAHPQDPMRLALVASDDGASRIVAIDLATGAETEVAPTAYLQALYPTWGSDGESVWFSCQMAVGAHFELCHARPGDTDVTVIPTAAGSAWAPAISPNGDRVAYRGAFGSTHVVRLNGTSAQTVSSGSFFGDGEVGVAWGADVPLPQIPPPPPAPTVPPPPPPQQPLPAGGVDGDPATTEIFAQNLSDNIPRAVSQARFADAGTGEPAATAQHVVLATSAAFADSLAGSALTADAPMLVVSPRRLDLATADELRRLLAPGGTVYLLGSDAALPPTIEQEVRDLGFVPRRLSGPTRFETALAVAREVVALGGSSETVLVARAFGPPGDETAAWVDSVAAGAYAGAAGVPILLTTSDTLHPTVQTYLDETGARPILLGGTAAISDAVAQDLGDPQRIAGSTRAGTAAAIATDLIGLDVNGPRTVVVVDGELDVGWISGLVGSGIAAELEGAVLLSLGGSLPEETRGLLAACDDPMVETLLLGHRFSVTPSLQDSVDALDGGADCEA